MGKLISILFFLILGSFSLQAQTLGSTTVKDLQIGANVRVNGTKTVFGPDTTATLGNKKYATIRAIVSYVNGRLADVYAYINTADTIRLDGTLKYESELLGVKTSNITFDTVTVQHLKGGTGVPTGVTGLGAGQVGGGATITVTGTDLAGEITITAGTSPAFGQPSGGIQYTKAFTTAPYVMLTPSNGNASGEGNFYIGSFTTTGFTFTHTGGTMDVGVVYKYHYTVIQ